MKDKSLKEKVILIFITVATIGLVVAITINYRGIINMFNRLLSILTPFIYSMCIAYLLAPLCDKIECKLNNKMKKHSEVIAVAITETMFITLLIIVVSTVVPQSVKSVGTIIETIPQTWKSFQITMQNAAGDNSFISNLIGGNIEEFNKALTSFIDTKVLPNIDIIITEVASHVTDFGKTILNIIIGIIISIFVLSRRKIFVKHTKIVMKAVLSEKVYKAVTAEIEIANKMFGGFLVGKIIDSIIIGLMCFLSLAIMDMPYAILVSVIVGITNIIPILGPFIGAVPGTIIIFSASPVKSLYFIIFIVVLQQIDGNIIGPKCIGSATGLPTFWTLFAIMFFGGLWGIVGMLIGVPLLAVLFDIGKKIIKHLINKRSISLDDIE